MWLAVRPRFEVRFQKPLTLLQLTPTSSVSPHHRFRHRFGVDHRSPTPRENPLPFFQLLVESTAGHPTHNRTVEVGDYCKPFKSSGDQVIIQKSGSDCPTGFYSSGNYCKRISSSDREALPRENGGKCPTGWRRSGEYCLNYGN